MSSVRYKINIMYLGCANLIVTQRYSTLTVVPEEDEESSQFGAAVTFLINSLLHHAFLADVSIIVLN